MELLDTKVPKGEFTLRLTSDWQVGSVSTSTKVIDKVMEPIYECSNYRVAFLGDLVDNISPADAKRFSWDDLDMDKPNLLSQMRFVKSIIKPAADKGRVVSLGAGNHCFTSNRDIGDPTIYMAEELRVPYGGYSAILRMNKEDEILLWHGRPSINSTLPDAQSRRMAIKRRLVRTNRARWQELPSAGRIKLFAQGHVNHLEVVRPEESRQMHMGIDWDAQPGHRIRNEYVNSDSAFYAVCGSAQRLFCEGRTTYAEARGYSPISLGTVDCHFRGGRLLDVEAIPLG